MKEVSGSVIYIGKAKNLKKRLTSYFTSPDTKDIKTTLLVSHIHTIDTIVTHSEKEALILENQLIKAFLPKYNINLKDDKSYPYLKLTFEPFPKLLIVRQKIADRASYFGPYPNLGSTRRLIKLLHVLFPIRDCAQEIDLLQLQKKCIKLDLGTCLGPCVDKSVKADYDQAIEGLKLLLQGKNRQVISFLKAKMQGYSDRMAFEKAANLRDQLERLEKISTPQVVDVDLKPCVQVWAGESNTFYHYALVQTWIEGRLMFQSGYYDTSQSDRELFFQESIDNHLAKSERPDSIICDEQMAAYFTHRHTSIQVIVPQRSTKAQIVEGAARNARLSLLRLSREQDMLVASPQAMLGRIAEKLGLSKVPNRVIGIDISHLSATNIVGSAVYFFNGKPFKKQYRSFNIRTVTKTSHDPASIYEVVARRLRPCVEGEEVLPDLLLIDGGIGQLSFAIAAVNHIGLSGQVELISLAKQQEEIYTSPDKPPIQWSLSDPDLHFFQRVRDEAHRFAVALQRKKRRDFFDETVLSGIPGLGESRIRLILRTYKTIDALAEADLDELAKLGRMGRKLAQKVLSTVA